jgi:glycerate 2-kinase
VHRVLVAPDKFKGSLTAPEVAAAVARGLTAGRSDVEVSCLPVADGGDGTLAAALAAGYEAVPVTATGPTGEPVQTAYARLGDVAVVEMADVSGLGRLPGGRFAPRTATSRGTGEVVAAALGAGARRVVLGIGGSATTDGGAGLMQALGAQLLDADGAPVGPGGAGLERLARVDVSGVAAVLQGAEVVVASDVDNPLTGPSGAAAVYGPQKGASPSEVGVLEAGLARWGTSLGEVVGVRASAGAREPGAGAAGGVGYACLVVLGAVRRPGIDVVLELGAFAEHLAGADLAVTGEGSLDAQTLHGKAPAGVAARARAAGVPVVAVAGRCLLDPDDLRAAGIADSYPLTELEPDLRRCMQEPGPLLERLGERIALDRLIAVQAATEGKSFHD